MKTIKLNVPKVSNLNGVVNQFEINGPNFNAFQSYRSIIVLHKNGKTYLDAGTWDYSVTTGRYRNMYLGENKAETQKKINSGEYILADLNPS